MTLSALKFERKEEKEHPPECCVQRWKSTQTSSPGSLPGADARGPLLGRVHLLPSESQPGPLSHVSGGGESCTNIGSGNRLKGLMRAPGRPQGYRGHRFLGTLQRPGLCKHEIKTMASLALQRDKCLS